MSVCGTAEAVPFQDNERAVFSSRPPPARREDPFGVCVEEPPDQYRCSDDEHAEDLVAAEGAPLDLAPFVFGDLLIMRLDAAFDHSAQRWVTTDSIGGSAFMASYLRV